MNHKDMLDDFKKTKYWEYMIDRFDEINEERISFNIQFDNMLHSSTDQMAIVLKCHLIIEYYIDEYIKYAFPSIKNIEKMNLRFANKVEMINNQNTTFGMYYKSLKQINSLRNKFAHNLDYEIRISDVNEIAVIINAFNNAGGYTITLGVELIKQYTMWFCSTAFSTTKMIIKETKELGISGYIKWMKEMNEKIT